MTSEEIKESVSIREVLQRCGLPAPNRAGFIQCPFHKGDRTPSMKIYQKDYHCFACGANGDVFTFLLNSLPMILDDTSKVSARIRDNFEGIVYDLCSGKGKSRSNKELGMNRENKWRNAILTNGERPLSSYVTQGGAINRILEVECGENIYCDPQATVETLKKNYGYAGNC